MSDDELMFRQLRITGLNIVEHSFVEDNEIWVSKAVFEMLQKSIPKAEEIK